MSCVCDCTGPAWQVGLHPNVPRNTSADPGICDPSTSADRGPPSTTRQRGAWHAEPETESPTDFPIATTPQGPRALSGTSRSTDPLRCVFQELGSCSDVQYYPGYTWLKPRAQAVLCLWITQCASHNHKSRQTFNMQISTLTNQSAARALEFSYGVINIELILTVRLFCCAIILFA